MLQVPLRRLREAAKGAITLTMSTVRTNAAAAMLGVSPNTLRSWERRFGYPKPRRTQGGHRQFELAELEALRQAFAETHNISSAITVARERGEGPSTAMRLESAFAVFDEDQAGRLLEQSLAVRSVERTVEEVLLPAVEALAGDDHPHRSCSSHGDSRAAGWPPRSGWRRPPTDPRACCCSTPQAGSTWTRCTRRRSSSPSVAGACGR